MKTKLAFAMLFMMMGVAQVRANAGFRFSSPSLEISRKGESAIFLVKYVGSQTTDLNVKIKDGAGNVLVSEFIKDVKGFSLPVNMEGAGEGTYMVEVGDKTLRQVGTLEFTHPDHTLYSHVTKLNEKEFMLSVAHEGAGKIAVRILDEGGAPVYENVELIDGNFGKLYKFPRFAGTPSFEVTDVTGR